jgi:hypothetical protein
MKFTCALTAILKPLLKPGDSSTIFAIRELWTVNLQQPYTHPTITSAKAWQSGNVPTSNAWGKPQFL